MPTKKLLTLYALTYIAIVFFRRLVLTSSWSTAFLGRFPISYLAMAITSIFLYPALQQRARGRDSTDD